MHAALILDDADTAQEVVSWTNGQLAEQQRIRASPFGRRRTSPHPHPQSKERGGDRYHPRKDTAGESGCITGRRKPGGRGKEPAPDHQRGEQTRCRGGAGRCTLGDDLDLDSLGRVELLSAIEAEFGVYMDESQLSPEMTVRCLEALVEEGSRNPPMMSFPGWGMQWWCRILRGFLQRVVIFPVVSLPFN